MTGIYTKDRNILVTKRSGEVFFTLRDIVRNGKQFHSGPSA